MNKLVSAAVNTRLLFELAKLDDPDADFELASNDICECYERGDRLPNLLPIYRKLRGELFWGAFHATWAWCYDTWPYRRPLLALLTRHHHCSLAREDDGGEPLTIYRGC